MHLQFVWIPGVSFAVGRLRSASSSQAELWQPLLMPGSSEIAFVTVFAQMNNGLRRERRAIHLRLLQGFDK